MLESSVVTLFLARSVLLVFLIVGSVALSGKHTQNSRNYKNHLAMNVNRKRSLNMGTKR